MQSIEYKLHRAQSNPHTPPSSLILETFGQHQSPCRQYWELMYRPELIVHQFQYCRQGLCCSLLYDAEHWRILCESTSPCLNGCPLPTPEAQGRAYSSAVWMPTPEAQSRAYLSALWMPTPEAQSRAFLPALWMPTPEAQSRAYSAAVRMSNP